MRVIIDDAFELDDDVARVDRDALWTFLSQRAYWQRWRHREDVERQVDTATRVIGVYRRDGGAMVGFARSVSDGSMAYLSDVYIDESVRGRTLGKALVHEMVTRDGASSMRWLLHTDDAHGLYRQFGFHEPTERLMERDPITTRNAGRATHDGDDAPPPRGPHDR
ncbi:MAG: GNAT family N-acetyltransferase [Acidimicrobiales bacterium]